MILPMSRMGRLPIVGRWVSRAGTTVGSHIADLVALKKVIMLCSDCEHKFDRKRAGYAVSSLIPNARGACDGCQNQIAWCKAFLHRNSHQLNPLNTLLRE